MTAEVSFGAWLKQRRRVLDLTQDELARQVGCSTIALRKIEAEERRPSKQIAERLAERLGVDPGERSVFVRYARGEAHAHTPDVTIPRLEATPWRASRRRTNLPAPLTPLIGRDQDVTRVREAMLRDNVHLLTLTGPAGVGKTRLAMQAAADLLDRFDDGVFFVALASLRSPLLALSTIAQTLGLKENGTQPLSDRVTEYLENKHILLLLDNFEQIMPAATAISDLLAACRLLKILVTSRARLHLRAERLYPVQPLGLPQLTTQPDPEALSHYPAVEMFVDRVQAVKPDFTLTRDNAEVVVAICARLDGLPLAIELVAARMISLPPQQILARLTEVAGMHSFRMSIRGPRDLAARQRTLRNAVDWSYDILARDEQTLFRRLAVFVGGCTLEAAQAIAGPVAVSGNFTSLVDKNLLVHEPTVEGARYDMLETIREYTLEQLKAADEHEGLCRQHAAYYLAQAETAELHGRGTDLTAWLNRMEGDHDNYRAALHWARESGEDWLLLQLAGALSSFWEMHGHLSEGRHWLDEALAKTEERREANARAERQYRARALEAAGTLAHRQGDDRRAVKVYESALILYGDIGDQRGTANMLGRLGEIAMSRGDPASARAYFEESLAMLRVLDDKPTIGNALTALGHASLAQGDYATAQSCFEESLALHRHLGNKWGMVNALNGSGDAARCRADYQQAAAYYEECLPLLRGLGHKGGMSATLANLGYVAHGLGDATQASAHFKTSLTLAVELGFKPGIANCLAGLAAVAGLLGQAERAARLLGAAEGLFSLIGEVMWTADRLVYEHSVDVIRAQLGDSISEAVRATGRAMTLEQAIRLALE